MNNKKKSIYFFIIFFSLFFSQNIFSANDNNIIEKNISNGFNTPVNIIILNTVEDDFAPFYNHLNNELIFNSIHKNYSKYFVSKIFSDFSFSVPKLLNSQLNENRQNRSYFTLIDEKQALVSAFNQTKRGSFLNIQKSIFERNAWSAPSPIPEFSDSFFIAHPTVSPNGEMLVFASNKNSPNKKTDLWFAAKQPDGSWSMMLPIDELNSNGNEITPFFLTDSLLIFASDGFEGIGGFDLYYSFFSSGRWSKPHPLEGINTEFNESDPAALPNGTLIFASDRAGGIGKLDLYSATVIINEILEEPETPFSISATTFTVEVIKSIKYELTVENTDEISEIKFEIFPPFIQFFVKSDNNFNENNTDEISENYIYNYNYKLFCDGNLLYENNFDFLQEDFYLNFEEFSSKIFDCDLLILEVFLKNKNTGNINFTRTVNIELIKIENRELIKQ